MSDAKAREKNHKKQKIVRQNHRLTTKTQKGGKAVRVSRRSQSEQVEPAAKPHVKSISAVSKNRRDAALCKCIKHVCMYLCMRLEIMQDGDEEIWTIKSPGNHFLL